MPLSLWDQLYHPLPGYVAEEWKERPAAPVVPAKPRRVEKDPNWERSAELRADVLETLMCDRWKAEQRELQAAQQFTIVPGLIAKGDALSRSRGQVVRSSAKAGAICETRSPNAQGSVVTLRTG